MSRGETEPNNWPVSEACRRMVKLLPLSFPATWSASAFSVSERTSSSPFIVSKRVRFSAVARNALPRGKRKLRAKPSLTRTTSPIWPSLATRSSRITSMRLLLRGSADHIGEQPKKARAFDRLGEFALFLCRHRRDPAGNDFSAFRHEPLQQLDVLVIDLRRVGARKRAALAAPKERP